VSECGYLLIQYSPFAESRKQFLVSNAGAQGIAYRGVK